MKLCAYNYLKRYYRTQYSSRTYPLPCHYALEGNTIVDSDKDVGILVSNNLNFTCLSFDKKRLTLFAFDTTKFCCS